MKCLPAYLPCRDATASACNNHIKDQHTLTAPCLLTCCLPCGFCSTLLPMQRSISCAHCPRFNAVLRAALFLYLPPDCLYYLCRRCPLYAPCLCAFTCLTLHYYLHLPPTFAALPAACLLHICIPCLCYIPALVLLFFQVLWLPALHPLTGSPWHYAFLRSLPAPLPHTFAPMPFPAYLAPRACALRQHAYAARRHSAGAAQALYQSCRPTCAM